MKDTTVAQRYAAALFLLTEKRGDTARALEDLKGLWEVVRPGTPVGRLLDTPQVLLADKRRVIQQALEGRAERTVVMFVDLLLRKKRLRELENIVTQYESLVERAQGIQRGEVVSAVPLTDSEFERIHRELERLMKSKIRLIRKIEPEVTGGALVRIEGRVIDRTVHTLLERMRERLFEAVV
jgi:F-type H+-transporting ATPase subunit delta